MAVNDSDLWCDRVISIRNRIAKLEEKIIEDEHNNFILLNSQRKELIKEFERLTSK